MDFSESEGVEKEEDGSDEEVTMAHQAAISGDVHLLLQAIKDDPSLLEQVDGEGLTPLARAVMAGQIEVVKRLVKIGASIHAQDELGRTVLAMAAYQGWYDGVVFLLRNGAKQNMCDKAGRTPLHAATYDTDPRTLTVLLQNMASNEVNMADYEGMTALHWVAFHDRPQHLELLLGRGGDINLVDIDGKTCLHWAAQNGSLKCCQTILQYPDGALLINKVDHSGKSTVHFAAAAGHTKILKLLASVPGCDLEPEDPDERTPLHWAAATGQTEVARLLLQLGVSPEPIDSEGGTPLDYAKQTNHTECINAFEQHLGIKMTQPTPKAPVSRESSPRQLSAQSSGKSPFSFFMDLFKKKPKDNDFQQANNKDVEIGEKNKPESKFEKLHLSRLDNPKSQQLGELQPPRNLDLPIGGRKSPLPPTGSIEHMIRSPPPTIGNPVENDVKKNKKSVSIAPPVSPKPQQLAPLKGAPKLGALPPSMMHEKVAALKRETAKHRTPTPPATLEQVLESQGRTQRHTSLAPAGGTSSNLHLDSNQRDLRHVPNPAHSDSSQRKNKSKRNNMMHKSINNGGDARGDNSPRSLNSQSDSRGHNSPRSLNSQGDTRGDNSPRSILSEGGTRGGNSPRGDGSQGVKQSEKMRSSPRTDVPAPQLESYKQQRMELDKHLQGLLY